MWKSAGSGGALAENKTDYSKYGFLAGIPLLLAYFLQQALYRMFYRSWLGRLAFPAVWKGFIRTRQKEQKFQKERLCNLGYYPDGNGRYPGGELP